MKYVDILFDAYLPDLGGAPYPPAPGYLVDAVGVRPTPNGWRGMPTFENITSATALPSVLTFGVGASYETTSDVHFFIANNGGQLFESRNQGIDTWENVSPTGTAVDGQGDFIRFGDDVVYVCGTRAPVSKDLSASHATDFAALAGSPPTASCGARVRRHMVLGGLSTDPYAVQTSAIGDHEDWPTPGTADARSKQSILESLNPEFGPVRRILGGEELGIVVQDLALTRMTYVGGSVVYEFDTYDSGAGEASMLGGSTSVHSRPVTDGRVWYFYNHAGVYVTDGYGVVRISERSIDESLFTNTIGHPNGSTLTSGIAWSSAFDFKRNLLLLGGPIGGVGTSRGLVYSPTAKSFALMAEEFACVFNGLRSLVSTPNGRIVYNVNTNDDKLQRLTGATGTIALQTGYLELEPGYRVSIQKAHLLGADVPGSLTLSYKTAATLNDVDTLQSGFTAMTSTSRGEGAAARADAPYVAFRVTGTGSEAQLIRGIRIFYERTSQL